MHFTSFSPNGKNALKRDVHVSSNETQILEIAETLIAKNVKKGREELN
jgi:hypothetical protein